MSSDFRSVCILRAWQVAAKSLKQGRQPILAVIYDALVR